MIDRASDLKARADWANVQIAADVRFAFDKSRRAYLGAQSHRITVNVDICERLGELDAMIFGRDPPSAPGLGAWPFMSRK